MAQLFIRPAPLAGALAAAALAWPVAAQTTPEIVITGRGLGVAGVTGFGQTAAAQLPMAAVSFGSQQLADTATASIGALARLDASLSEAYDATGYWGIISARGYTLDNRFNYRRDGLPINAETVLALDNKERLEVLKGTSGMQAGTSAPGGLVNLVVKRPTGTVRMARLELRQPGAVLGAVDLGDRFGPDDRLGVRLNAALERLDPSQRHTQGERGLFALALDWQADANSLLQAEIEWSHQRQPSVVGFSMLGNSVPDPSRIDPRLNLNDQPWRQPVVMDGLTASLRWQQRIAENWTFTAHALQQRLKSDDRTAFPYGVYDPTTYGCPQWCDRYAPDGSFTYWQYVSDNERRVSNAVSLALAGQARAAGLAHEIEAGVLWSRYRGRFQDQVYDIAGIGNIDGSLQTPPSPGGSDANTNRDERSTEIFARDAVQLGAHWRLFAGMRHTTLSRSSARTSPAPDGLQATGLEQALTTPWLALAHALAPHTSLYASWGQGLESDVVPNREIYLNAGQPLPALRSRQVEAGFKHEGEAFDGALTWFDIDRPQAADIGSCSGAGSCTRQIDGSARHRGVEAWARLRTAATTLQASAMWLDAKRLGSSLPQVNGMRPVNVPRATLRMAAEYRVAALPGLALLANFGADGDRAVLPYDAQDRVPGWSRWDLGLRWREAVGARNLVWRAGVDNVLDRRAWKESPYQFSHVYLYPLEPRTWRGSVQLEF